MDLLLEPLRYSFLLRGLTGGILSSLACSALSAFIVWRRMSFMGDALSHSVLPGIVVAYILGINLFWGALIAALLVVALIGFISSRTTIGVDAAIGVVFVGFFALGIIVLSKVATSRDLNHILFGNILGVSQNDLIMMSIVVFFVLTVVTLAFKELLTASFDPAHAFAIGLSPSLVRYILLSMLALTTVAAIQTVGVVLVLALLVAPGAAASLVSKQLKGIMTLSIIMAVLATIIGFYISYFADIASGPAIVITLTSMFLVCAMVAWFKKFTNAK